MVVPGSSIGPPNETIKAVRVIDRKGGRMACGVIFESKAYKPVAKRPDIKVASITMFSDIGLEIEVDSAIGIK